MVARKTVRVPVIVVIGTIAYYHVGAALSRSRKST